MVATLLSGQGGTTGPPSPEPHLTSPVYRDRQRTLCHCAMPTLPHGLMQWSPSGFFTALLGLIWYEVKASEARLNKRIDELREDQKASEARQREHPKHGLGRLEAVDPLRESRFPVFTDC
ncbi:MAG: hypothetical protein OXI08_02660 [Cyanobacteria bacterium MAG IRC4_bin_6]|nr:hypothetical protein [Cyanobacteria bacterium MAG IRC4_bin_6]